LCSSLRGRFSRHDPLNGGPPPEVTVWLRPLITAFGWLILAKAAAGFFAGWGLLQREEWARTVALVVGFLALLNVPIGTALGIYTLWVLRRRNPTTNIRPWRKPRSWATSVGSLGYVGVPPDCRNCDRVLESKTGIDSRPT